MEEVIREEIIEEKSDVTEIIEEEIPENVFISDEEVKNNLVESFNEITTIKPKTDEEEKVEEAEPVKEEKPGKPKKGANKIKDSKDKLTAFVKTGDDEKDAKNLYDEFSSFLETRADITADEGVKIVLPTGIDILDAHLGGGIAVGAMAIIVGSPGSGKTTLAIQTLANAQKVFKGDLIGSFLDSEEATTIARLSNLGVNYPKIKPYSDVTVEKVFKFLEGLCLFKEEKKIIDKPSIVIWDSIANTLSQKEREVEDINSVIGYKARLLSILIPKYVAKCAKYGICFLAINQLRDSLQMGQFSAPADLKFMSHTKIMPGGNAIRFNAIQLLEMRVKKALLNDKDAYGFDGIISTVKVVKNKLFAPNLAIDIVGSFVYGFSNFWTSYKFLVESKRLISGAWNYLAPFPTNKFRTKDAENMYNTDVEFKKNFDDLVKEAIKIDIIEKYDVSV